MSIDIDSKRRQKARKLMNKTKKIQCPRCLHWVDCYNFSLSKDLCESCIEDEGAQDTEDCLWADYRSSRL